MRAKRWVLASAAAMIAAGAFAQDSLLPPGFDQPPPAPAPAPQPTPAPRPAPPPVATPTTPGEAVGDRLGEVSDDEELEDPLSPLDETEDDGAEDDGAELRPVRMTTTAASFGDSPWGASRQQFLVTLMRRLDTPLALRWGHIGLRNALMASGEGPEGLSSSDWVAERAWLLLRMGEADAARLLVASVPKSRWSERLTQVALQSALASSDLAAMCPLPSALDDVEASAEPLVAAICAALSGQPEIASDAINRERRRGRVGGIDLALAEKLVGAGSATARAVTLEWEPVTRLNSWRYGLASATGVSLPDRLLEEASPQVVAWHARAPLLSAQQRIPSARVATGMGVFSGQAMTDLYAQFYDREDADTVSGSEALTLRRAFVAADLDDRLEAMRTILAVEPGDPVQRRASRAVIGRAAARLVPSSALDEDAPELVAAMFAVGLDESAARWVPVLADIAERDADPAWAQLALGIPDPSSIDVTRDRIDDFMDRDDSADKWRSKLLMAGLGGLGRMSPEVTASFDEMLDIGLTRDTRLTRELMRAARRGEAGTVMLLSSVAMQGQSARGMSPVHLYHVVRALRATGHDYLARMIAAEALAPA